MIEKPKLLRIQQTSVILPDGKLQPTYVVGYTVGDHGPFTTQVPAGEFTAKPVTAIMNKTAAEIAKIATGA